MCCTTWDWERSAYCWWWVSCPVLRACVHTLMLTGWSTTTEVSTSILLTMHRSLQWWPRWEWDWWGWGGVTWSGRSSVSTGVNWRLSKIFDISSTIFIRFILHVWDTKQRLMRYIYNSSSTRAATVRVPMCSKLYVKVEIQEDDLRGHAPDSEFTSVSEAALTATWLSDPVVNTNRSQVELDRSFSHWSKFDNPSYLKVHLVITPLCHSSLCCRVFW